MYQIQLLEISNGWVVSIEADEISTTLYFIDAENMLEYIQEQLIGKPKKKGDKHGSNR